jgi:hypothetical protein
MKAIIDYLPGAEQVDLKDPVCFYEAYLNKVEECPAAACALDFKAVIGIGQPAQEVSQAL